MCFSVEVRARPSSQVPRTRGSCTFRIPHAASDASKASSPICIIAQGVFRVVTHRNTPNPERRDLEEDLGNLRSATYNCETPSHSIMQTPNTHENARKLVEGTNDTQQTYETSRLSFTSKGLFPKKNARYISSNQSPAH